MDTKESIAAIRINEVGYDELCMKYGKHLVDKEIELELESKDLAYQSFMSKINKARENKTLADTGTTKVLLKEALPAFCKGLKSFYEKADSGKPGKRHICAVVLKQLEIEHVAFLSLRTILSNAIPQVNLTSLAKELGTELELEMKFQDVLSTLSDKERSYFQVNLNKRIGMSFKQAFVNAKDKWLADENRKERWEKWTDSVRCNLGMKLIDIFIVSTGLGKISKYSKGGSFNITYRFEIVPEIVQYIAHNDKEMADLLFKNRPMVIPPKPWSNPINGGYYINLKRPIPLVRLNEKTVMDLYGDLDMPDVYKAVNAIQETPWRINQRVLKVAHEISKWKHIPEGLEMPLAEPEEPPVRPEAADKDPNVQKEWRKAMVIYFQRDNKRKSKRYAVNAQLALADIYKDYERIYFPHNLDFRGRVYPLPMLNPQGTDFCKSLLEFADGAPLGDSGVAWLAIQGANCYGLDKKPLEERIAWVYENTELILRTAKDPLTDLEWTETDSPWEFLAFCFEWADFMEQGTEYVSHIPVAFDGSCSGIQHFSAMLKDEIGGTAVNLVPDDKVHDIYGIVAEHVKQAVMKDAAEGTEDEFKTAEDGTEYVSKGTKALANEWLAYGITRKVTKRPTMTLSYGAKKFGFTEQILEDTIYPHLEHNPLAFSKPRQAATYMADKIWNSLGEVVVKAREAMDWLQTASCLLATDKNINGENLPTQWVTPSGFLVRQRYPKVRLKKLKTFCSGTIHVTDESGAPEESKKEGETFQISVSEDLGEIDSRKQKQGIAPNYVHSMDASHLMLTVDACVDAGIHQFAMIHDSYGCPAGQGDLMFSLVREVFAETYKQNDVLQDLHDQVENMLSPKKAKELPPIPKHGTLDLDVVKQSMYAFC